MNNINVNDIFQLLKEINMNTILDYNDKFKYQQENKDTQYCINDEKGRHKWLLYITNNRIKKDNKNISLMIQIKDNYSYFDVYMQDIQGYKYLVEIKNRDYKYSLYDDMLIEYDKYMNLKLLRNCQKDVKILYVNTYDNSNIIKVANITNMDIDFFDLSCQKTNDDNNIKKEKKIALIKQYKVINDYNEGE